MVMKIIIETDLKESDNIGAVSALVRLFEYYESDVDFSDVSDPEQFWGIELPEAVWKVFGAIQAKLTAYELDANDIRIICEPNHWLHTINMVKQEINELAKIQELYEKTRRL